MENMISIRYAFPDLRNVPIFEPTTSGFLLSPIN